MTKKLRLTDLNADTRISFLCISEIAPVALFSLLIGTKTETPKYQFGANYILVFFAYWQSSE
jgi:hypothetical protein